MSYLCKILFETFQLLFICFKLLSKYEKFNCLMYNNVTFARIHCTVLLFIFDISYITPHCKIVIHFVFLALYHFLDGFLIKVSADSLPALAQSSVLLDHVNGQAITPFFFCFFIWRSDTLKRFSDVVWEISLASTNQIEKNNQTELNFLQPCVNLSNISQILIHCIIDA